MKLILLVAALISVTQALANPNCSQREAQISGHVKAVDVFTNGCRVLLTEETRIQQHAFCPLDEALLATQGIEVGLHKEHVCSYEVGEPISGILIEKGGYIILE